MTGRRFISFLAFVSFLTINAVVIRHAYNTYTCGSCGAGTEESEARRVDELARARTLAVGDSRMAVGFDPRDFPASYNDGMFGANFAQVYFRLRQSLQTATAVDTVLISVGPYTFVMGPDNPRGTNAGIPTLPTATDSVEFYRVLGTDFIPSDTTTSQEREYLAPVRDWLANAFPYAGQSQVLWDRYRMPPAESAFMGYTVREVASQTAPRSGKDRAEAIFAHIDGPSEIATHYLQRSIKLCQERGIDVVLVRLPVSDEYLTAVRSFVSDETYSAWLDSLLQETPARYVDMHREFVGRKGLFQDGDHLNGRGASAATKLLHSILQSD